MDEPTDLYQEMILDHSRSPRNYGVPAHVTHRAEGYNPLCGDHYHVYLQIADERILHVGFEGAGCAISKASASMMTSAVRGKTRGEAAQTIARFRELLTGAAADPDGLGKLVVFGGVRQYPSRVKCAALAWHTLKAALEGATEATTE